MNRNPALLLSALGIVVVVFMVALVAGNRGGPSAILTFNDCMAAGNPVMESLPRQCRTQDGRVLTETVAVSSSPGVSSAAAAGSGSFSSIASAAASVSAEANIVVTEPAVNRLIGSPLVIRGRARVFENVFHYRILAEDGRVLAQGDGTAAAPDTGQFGAFEVSADFVPAGERGTVEAYSLSPRDGSVTDLVSVPVRFTAGDTTEVKVFFGSRTAPSGRECEALTTVSRTVPKTSTARAALEELLKGPIGDANAITAIAAGTTLNSLTVDNGVARADFSAQLQNYGGGSCTVSLIREQIEKTLLQFPTVRQVMISVEGRADDVLQP